MKWYVMVLIPNGGYKFQVIGLVDLMRKLISTIINGRGKLSVKSHNFIQIFSSIMGGGNTIIEAKFFQQLIYQH